MAGDVLPSPCVAELRADCDSTGHLTGRAYCAQVMKSGTSEAQRRRLGEGGLMVAVDARSQRLLRYEEMGTRGAAAMDAHCWGERNAVEARPSAPHASSTSSLFSGCPGQHGLLFSWTVFSSHLHCMATTAKQHDVSE